MSKSESTDQKQARYMMLKKVVIQLMEVITSKPKAVVIKHLKTQVKELSSTLNEKVTTESLINEFSEGRGRNCMHFAAASGSVEIFEALVEHGGDPLRSDDEGNTVLMIAI
jgi:ankyrin repeat protein